MDEGRVGFPEGSFVVLRVWEHLQSSGRSTSLLLRLSIVTESYVFARGAEMDMGRRDGSRRGAGAIGTASPTFRDVFASLIKEEGAEKK